MKSLIALLVAFLLAGCASSYRLGSEALMRGDLQTAEQQLTLAIRQGDTGAWNNLGLVYQRQGKTKQAIDAYNMGARYGDPTARANLARSNLPVPPADLMAAPSSKSNSDVAAGLLDSFGRGYQGGSVSCTSYGFPDLMRTNCR